MIALVQIASEFFAEEDMRRPPSGCLYVGGALKSAGHDVRVYHIKSLQMRETAEEIVNKNPLFVGFSAFTGYPAMRSAQMSKLIKEMDARIRIVWGGIHSSLIPEQVINEPFVDVVVVGEGEETAVELADAFLNSRPLDGIAGIVYKKNNTVVTNKRRSFIGNIDRYTMDWSLVKPADYVKLMHDSKRGLHYISSRGCPFKCGFCYNVKFNESKWRSHSIQHIAKNLKWLKETTEIEAIVFDDDNFFTNPEHSFQVLELLKDLSLRCYWLNLRWNYINKENLSRLVNLNVRHIFFGWESGSDRLLGLMKKGTTRQIILEKCRILSKYPQIGVDAGAIIGFPTESRNELRQTIGLAIEIARILPNVTFNLGTYLPFPGTDLYELAVKDGFLPPAYTEGWGIFDHQFGSINLEWIKWRNKSIKKDFYLIDKYAKLLNRSQKSNSWFKNLLKQAISNISAFRLKHYFFKYPLEVTLFVAWVKFCYFRKHDKN